MSEKPPESGSLPRPPDKREVGGSTLPRPITAAINHQPSVGQVADSVFAHRSPLTAPPPTPPTGFARSDRGTYIGFWIPQTANTGAPAALMPGRHRSPRSISCSAPAGIHTLIGVRDHVLVVPVGIGGGRTDAAATVRRAGK